MTSTIRPLRRALISVSDKTGLLEFAQFLTTQNVEILSTGGTAKALRDAGIAVIDVSEVTGFPEILDGRVKTLHPKVHGAILGKASDPTHKSVMDEFGIEAIDLVVVNLYPFEATLAAGGSYDECVANIDIGGPAMIRAAAKNHDHVTIITDSEDYEALIADVKANGGTSEDFRKQQAQIAYARTAAYDAAISSWLADALEIKTPRRVVRAAKLASGLRYGENPHQNAAFYLPETTREGFGAQNLVQGKELSYNNLNDADAAYGLIREFPERPACAIIKHANPCGVAMGDSILDAYQNALACDPVSAFGGIIAVNRELDEDTANAILELFTEVVICPAISDAAKAAFARKPNIRLLILPYEATKPTRIWRDIDGGVLLQDADNGVDDALSFQTVTKRAPSDEEMQDLLFAWRVAKHVKSNAIVYCKEGRTVGVGAGQMSRVDSARIAVQKSLDMKEAQDGAPTKGAVVASDAFFPFADGLLQAAEAGVTAVIQPGGSMRDDEVIAAADEHNLAMVFTGLRHFRH